MKLATILFRSIIIFIIIDIPILSWAQPEQNNDTSTQAPVSYSNVDNLNTYIDQIKASQNSTGDTYLIQAKALEECGAFKVTPAYADNMIRYLESYQPKYFRIKIPMYERMKSRCKEFMEVTQLRITDVEALYRKAANQGNSTAVAHTLVEDSVNMPEAEVLTRAIGIIKTKDPSAIFELSDLFQDNGPLAFGGVNKLNNNSSAVAVRLVACDLGYDCSSSSALVRQSCLFGGLCGADGYKENIREAGVSPEQFEEIVKAEASLLHVIQSGQAIDSVIVGAQR